MSCPLGCHVFVYYAQQYCVWMWQVDSEEYLGGELHLDCDASDREVVSAVRKELGDNTVSVEVRRVRGKVFRHESPKEARRTGSMAKTKPTTNQLAPGAAQDAQWLFDQLTGASYYGFAFREVLMKDPEARKAARTLVNQLKAAGVRGMD